MFDFGTVGFRKIEKTDLGYLVDLKHETWGSTHQVTICSMEDQIRWFESLDTDVHNPRDLVLMCYGNNCEEQSSNFIGPIGISKILRANYRNRSADVGWDIFARYRKQGWGKKMVQAGVQFCFKILGLQRLNAEILIDNSASIKCAYDSGFVNEGIKRCAVFRDGYFVDVLIFGALESDRRSLQSEKDEVSSDNSSIQQEVIHVK